MRRVCDCDDSVYVVTGSAGAAGAAAGAGAGATGGVGGVAVRGVDDADRFANVNLALGLSARRAASRVSRSLTCWNVS